MTTNDVARAAEMFKVMGHETRLRILQLLADRPHTVGELADATDTAQPLVSQHLRVLRQVGLVTFTRDGKHAHYRLADDHVTHVLADALVHVVETPHDLDQKETP